MRPVMANSGLILQLVLDTQCSAAIADLSKAKRTLSALHCQLSRMRDDLCGEHCTLRSRGLGSQTGGRVLPHPSCEAIELSHGLYVGGGATNGTRLREIRTGTRLFDALTRTVCLLFSASNRLQ